MRVLDNPNAFKLVVFGANVSGGCNLSTAPERITVSAVVRFGDRNASLVPAGAVPRLVRLGA